MLAKVSLKIIGKSDEKLLKLKLCKTLQHCFNYERTLDCVFLKKLPSSPFPCNSSAKDTDLRTAVTVSDAIFSLFLTYSSPCTSTY